MRQSGSGEQKNRYSENRFVRSLARRWDNTAVGNPFARFFLCFFEPINAGWRRQ